MFLRLMAIMPLLRLFMPCDISIAKEADETEFEKEASRQRHIDIVRAAKTHELMGLIIDLVRKADANEYRGAKIVKVLYDVHTTYRGPLRKPRQEPVMGKILAWRPRLMVNIMVGADYKIYRDYIRIAFDDLNDEELNRLLAQLPLLTEHLYGA